MTEKIELFIGSLTDTKPLREALRKASAGSPCLYLTHRTDYFDPQKTAIRQVYLLNKRLGKLFGSHDSIAKIRQETGWFTIHGEGSPWEHGQIMGERLRRLLSLMGKSEEFNISAAEWADLRARPDYRNPMVMWAISRECRRPEFEPFDRDDVLACIDES